MPPRIILSNKNRKDPSILEALSFFGGQLGKGIENRRRGKLEDLRLKQEENQAEVQKELRGLQTRSLQRAEKKEQRLGEIGEELKELGSGVEGVSPFSNEEFKKRKSEKEAELMSEMARLRGKNITAGDLMTKRESERLDISKKKIELKKPEIEEFKRQELVTRAMSMAENENERLAAQTDPEKFILKKAFPGKSLEDILVKLEQAKIIAEETKLKGGAAKEGAKVKANFQTTVELMKNMWDRKKEQLEEGGIFSGGGVVRGTAKKAGAKMRISGTERTAAFEGQQTETAAAIMRVITNQNRMVWGMFQLIKKSLPDELDTESFSKAKIEQSIRNAFGLAKAMRNIGLLKEIRIASDEELEDPESEINQTISSIAPGPLTDEDEDEIQKSLRFIFGSEESSDRKKTDLEKIRDLRKNQTSDIDKVNQILGPIR